MVLDKHMDVGVEGLLMTKVIGFVVLVRTWSLPLIDILSLAQTPILRLIPKREEARTITESCRGGQEAWQNVQLSKVKGLAAKPSDRCPAAGTHGAAPLFGRSTGHRPLVT